MISQLRYIISRDTNPYSNMGLEELLTHTAPPETLTLYLWQNSRTVVIGRNQNPWSECRVMELEGEGGFVARRLSGGGAVFHDLGNLNFTFIASKENYDLARQLEVILKAVAALGVPAVKSGRNDLTADGRKFSGNAFYSDGRNSYHHGTLLVNTDSAMLSRYLTASAAKMKSKGVASVGARVVNLREFGEHITIHALEEKLIEAMGQVYGGAPIELCPGEFEGSKELECYRAKFASREWRLGRKMELDVSFSKPFGWGEVGLGIAVDKGKVTAAKVYTDSMVYEGFQQLEQALVGVEFASKSMAEAVLLQADGTDEDAWRGIVNDIAELILEQGF